MKKNGFAPLIIILVIAILGIIGYFGYKDFPLKQKLVNIFLPSPLAISSSTANWKMFKSKNEGFTLSYPSNWSLEDSSSTNCGRLPVNGFRCRERFDFVSPDGIVVRYVEGGNEDRWSCGYGSICNIDVVKDISELSILNFGKAYLIKTEKIVGKNPQTPYMYPEYSSIYLHDPSSSETIPKIGENIFKDYSINFSLPSKFISGERVSIFVTSIFQKDEYLKQLTTSEFYNLPSVKQAEQIMRSITY